MKRTRWIYFLGFCLVSLLLLFSMYLQMYAGMVPCPLCTLQRFTFVIIGILFLLGLILYKYRVPSFIVNCLACFMSLIGIGLAGRQIWLQHFATDSNNECGVSLQYMMQVLPVNELIPRVFQGSAECSQRGWEFLSLNMPEWAIIWFIGFFVLSCYLLLNKR